MGLFQGSDVENRYFQRDMAVEKQVRRPGGQFRYLNLVLLCEGWMEHLHNVKLWLKVVMPMFKVYFNAVVYLNFAVM